MNRTVVNIANRYVFAPGLYQWDYGQILVPTGVELPQTYEVHFAMRDADTTMTVLGDSEGVLIPDELLTTAQPITAYIYLHEGESDGETEYKIVIPVNARPEPSDYEPTPVQQDVITQTIAALNAAQYDWEHMSATAVTLDPDEPATASYADGVLTLGIPKGEKGDDGGGGAVESVNGQTGAVVLDASDVGALPDTYTAPVQSVNNKTGTVTLNASDVGAISAEVDPTVPSWAKQPSKPTYTASEVGALPDTYTAPVTSVNGATGAVVIGNATTTTAGLMSATDKANLDTLVADYSSALVALGVI